MSLAIGTRLGTYEILAPLGAGGMGEVYRAHDTKLGRDVALKVLPEAFSQDSDPSTGSGSSRARSRDDRMVRFEREARLLASLNHPHIAAIYGLEEAAGVRAIAMELVEGENLAARIARGAGSDGGRGFPSTALRAGRPGASAGSKEPASVRGIPLDEALPLARQIADALEAAHEKGIIHRDLKPANVMVTPDDRVKVLDFGLAKALGYAGSEDPGLHQDATELANSPTISAIGTRAGIILGTAAYMSPEQARGKPLDRRTDVWSFGCLLYEMLTGRMAFRGDTVSDTLAKILEREPDWQALPEKTPPGVRRLLRRCLQKDARLRLRDMGDARMEIEEALAGPLSGASDAATTTSLARSAPSVPMWRHPLPIGLALLAVALASALLWSLRRAPESVGAPVPVVRFTITLPPNQQILTFGPSIAISPDGRELAFAVEEDRGQPGPVGDMIALVRRRLDELQARPIPSTEFCYSPFFSPDGESLGFVNGLTSKLMKVSLLGGSPQTLGGSPSVAVVWTDKDAVVYSTGPALFRVPVGGGPPETLLERSQLSAEQGEIFFGQPRTLPGTNALLVGVEGIDPAHATISLLSAGKRTKLLTDGTLVSYLATGHILYLRPTGGQALGEWNDAFVVPFDLARLQVKGKDVPVLEGIRYGQVAVSANGTLAYASGATGGATQQLTWTSLDGTTTPVDERLPTQKRVYMSPRVSPIHKRLLYGFGTSNADMQLVVRDLTTGTTQIVAGAPSWWAVWTPDGRRIVYAHLNPEGTAGNLYWKAADGTGAEERLTTATRHQQPLFVTADGRFVAYQEESAETGFDMWLLPLQGPRTPKVLLKTRANERVATLSPDGRSLAYASDQTGRDEIWVRPFPDGEGALQVSSDGGIDPLWAPDGATLFYTNLPASRLFAVPVRREPSLSFGVPSTIDGWWNGGIPYGRNYDITPDGRSLIMVSASSTAGNQITVVLNWFEELKQKLAARK